MNNDLISREALMKFPIRKDHYDRVNGSEKFVFGVEAVLEYAENLPAVDAEPVRHSKWVKDPDRRNHWHCRECKNVWGLACRVMHYCPNCGAKMDGD